MYNSLGIYQRRELKLLKTVCRYVRSSTGWFTTSGRFEQTKALKMNMRCYLAVHEVLDQDRHACWIGVKREVDHAVVEK